MDACTGGGLLTVARTGPESVTHALRVWHVVFVGLGLARVSGAVEQLTGLNHCIIRSTRLATINCDHRLNTSSAHGGDCAGDLRGSEDQLTKSDMNDCSGIQSPRDTI